MLYLPFWVGWFFFFGFTGCLQRWWNSNELSSPRNTLSLNLLFSLATYARMSCAKKNTMRNKQRLQCDVGRADCGLWHAFLMAPPQVLISILAKLGCLRPPKPQPELGKCTSKSRHLRSALLARSLLLKCFCCVLLWQCVLEREMFRAAYLNSGNQKFIVTLGTCF